VSYAVAVVAGYLAGSIPTGYWLVRAVKHADIRTLGSGNIGGTNVWRVFGWRLGLPVVVADTAKGFVPAFLATLFVSHLAGVVAGAAAMLGHWRPLFLRWQRGGKVVNIGRLLSGPESRFSFRRPARV
jgi:acyl phosphate:glycerol-3-phosphate acyltransferase